MTDQRLEDLRQRWEADPGSRVFLQLAEEYRHLGRIDDAVGVLEQGLERSPNHLSAKVALGRCRLEKKEHAVAAVIFEEVLERDPTQLVANRLLVDAYLGQGELAKAARRLDLYRLLNGGDPVIEDLQARLDASTAGAGASPEVSDDRLQDVSREAAAPEVALSDLLEAPPEPPASSGAGSEASSTEADGEPFPDLPQQLSRSRYLDGLHSEGLFEVPAVPPPPSVPPTPVGELEEGSLFDLAPPVGMSEGAPDLLGNLISGEASPEDGLAQDSRSEEPVAEQARHPAAPAPTASLAEDVSAPEAPAVEPAWAESAPEEPEPAAAELEEEDSAADQPSAEAFSYQGPTGGPSPVEELATVTLGNLYLNQGHREKAWDVFASVLRREPDNAAARAGLANAEGREDPPDEPVPEDTVLAARELLEGSPPSAGLTERKTYLLRSYLRRLRREA